ncbi:MAG: metallopeptidase TldD-related protein [Candidatus Cloacimonetes bacterium]|nr:metallopeptidase TldD-related protein [Candidatus Cloacimonadota bacterium]
MKEILRKHIDFMQKHAAADDYEITISMSESQDTRFAQNSVTQHIGGDFWQAHYRCTIDKKVGTYSTTLIDEENLLLCIQKAEEIAKNNSPDDDYSPTMKSEKFTERKTYFPSVEKLDTAKMIEIIKKCIDKAEAKNAKVSGILSKQINTKMYVTKNGFVGYEHSSNVEISMTMAAGHIETNIAYGHSDFDRLKIDEILSQIESQFDALSEMKSMDFAPIPVILRPQAVAQLFMHAIWFGFQRKMADQGMTPFTGLIGKKCLGEKLNFRSSISDPDLCPSHFSSALVYKDIDWVKAGVLENLTTSRDWAAKNNLQPCQPYNMIIDGEGLSEEELMKKVPRGLIVNNLWYIRLNDMKTSDFTGMTRDGVIYFEDGKCKHSVNNFRFNEQFIDLTMRILATGKPKQIDSGTKVPPILIDNFNFVDKTTF